MQSVDKGDDRFSHFVIVVLQAASERLRLRILSMKSCPTEVLP